MISIEQKLKEIILNVQMSVWTRQARGEQVNEAEELADAIAHYIRGLS